jgi:glycosyltransferase involved in cell wall biosynthesis
LVSFLICAIGEIFPEMSKYKIAMLLDNPFRPDLRVAKEAQALSEAGYQITIFAWDRDEEVERPKFEKNEYYQINRISIKTKYQLKIQQLPNYFRFAWLASKEILKGNFDILHCHDFLNLITGVILKILGKYKLVYDAHEIYFLMESKKYPKIVLYFMKITEFFLLRWVDVFITVGEKRVEHYRKNYEGSIYIIGNWYDPFNIENVTRENYRRRLSISSDDFVITYAGTLSPTRASEKLINSIQELNGNENIHWLVCGHGISSNGFKKEALNNTKLHYLGWIDDLVPILSASDALIYLMDLSHPYSNYNSPNTLFLSIAYNIPIIGVSRGEIGKVLIKDINAVLVDNLEDDTLNNSIIRIASDDIFYKQLKNNLKELQNQYSWQIAKKELVSIYNSNL